MPMRVLYVSEIQWRSQISRKHLIIRRFPAGWDVVFASPMNARASENSVRMRRDPVHRHVRFVSLPLPKPDSGIALVRALTGPLSMHGGRALTGYARSFRPAVVVCSYLWAAPVIPALRGLGIPVVYDLNDLHTEFYPRCRQRAEEHFRSLVASADEVVSSSSYLREKAGRGIIIGNGVDLDIFTGEPVGPPPEPLSVGPLAACENLVAYVGSIDDRINFSMLEATAAKLSGAPETWGLIVMGRISDSARNEAENLARRYAGSVLFTGPVPYEELPRYLSRARVGVAPFVLTQRTRAINPNKLYMYAAMNMNIVSTPFSEEIKAHGDLVRLAESPSQFATAVQEGLGDDDRRRVVRERIAIPNSWDEKAREFVRLLTRLAPA
jgi:teichuronic acid biosynthesis glycosyltransferase TuaH